MKIVGLEFVKTVTVLNKDLVDNRQAYSIGDGQWSLEATDEDGNVLVEFWGLNGTRPGEEAEDLWALLEEWGEQTAYKYKQFRAPDGDLGPLKHFWHEARRGRLHGCIVQL